MYLGFSAESPRATMIAASVMTFSHSGRQLALLCVHSATSFEYFITDIDGKSRRSFATVREFPSNLAWSSDDRCLIFSKALEAGPELHEVRISDGTIRKIPLVAGGFWPATSHDGTKLAFMVENSHVKLWRRDLLHPSTRANVYVNPATERSAIFSRWQACHF
jgi:hypothetical protein